MKAKKIAAVILAAGGSSRLGRPKQLLDWFGKPFIKQLIDITLKAELDPVLVVTGSSHEEVEQVIKDEKVVIVRNEKWESGQSSSMQAGCEALKNYDVDAFIVFLCDQPQVPIELVKTIREASKDKEFDIIGTSVRNKICPPTLFKINCIEGIMTLNGDQGGRALFNSYRTKILDWKDERLIQDSDTEEDYKKLIYLYSN